MARLLLLITPVLGVALATAPLSGVWGDHASVAAGPVVAFAATSVGEDVQLDRDKVRWGDPAKFDPKDEKPVGTVRSREVYEAIPAYKTIKKEGIREGSARWEKLMREATRDYKRVLRTVAAERGLVLIVEQGGIRGYGPVQDVTAALIAAL